MSKKKLEKPVRDPDHFSKRGVPYWWSPEWIRATSSSCTSFQKIVAIKNNGDVDLHMKSKAGDYSYIQGSIQREFHKWHTDREIDCILLGMDMDDLLKDESDNE